MLAAVSPTAIDNMPERTGSGMEPSNEDGYIQNGVTHPNIRYNGVNARAPSSLASLNVSIHFRLVLSCIGLCVAFFAFIVYGNKRCSIRQPRQLAGKTFILRYYSF